MKNIQFFLKKFERNKMKKLFYLLFYSFLFFGCSRIGFNRETRDSSQIIDYQFDSIISVECGENRELCSTGNGKNDPFFQASKENEHGYLTEYFEISSRSNLEILLVVDASDSMDDNLKETGKNLGALLSYIKDKNWRIAFITADHGDHNINDQVVSSEQWADYEGELPRFGKLMNLEKDGEILSQFILNHDMEEYEQIFKDTITRKDSSECKLPPYCHGVNEQPLRSLKAAISRYQKNSEHKRFFQPNTDTVVLIITDEDERRPDSRNATTAEQVIQRYNRIFAGQKKRLFGFSISIQDEECYNDERGWISSSGADYGRIISRLAELTGGRNISLCSEDYGKELEDISKITRSLVQSLTLQKIFYIPNTVKVSLSPNQPNISWKLYGRKLVFSGDIKPGTQIKVSYRYEE